MKLPTITPFLSASDQLAEPDLGIAGAKGFQSVIGNRPDSDAEDQPQSEILAVAAERLGLAYRYIPVGAGKVTNQDASVFAQMLSDVAAVPARNGRIEPRNSKKMSDGTPRIKEFGQPWPAEQTFLERYDHYGLT
ncbi:beta-lactamase hydrolase domain-containing protein [Microvirga pakistanensis]|uniref:beta-lactamase hydrolase domain-containing protein n=1 Tax=Microvirga pakistanensis TaxID=1682650 RepID=UPI001FCE9222|nr:sulfur transferase domain-containing protein [Microvirga pakistanensis]